MPELNVPPFQHLQFIFENLTIINSDDQLHRISINAGTSLCVLCTDQKLMNHREWNGTSKSYNGKNFNIGKSIVVDGKIDKLEAIVDTSTSTFKGTLSINDIIDIKPTRKVITIYNQLGLLAFELQCIVLRRPLHFQSNTIQPLNRVTIAVQTENNQSVSISTQTERQVQFREVGVNSINNSLDNSTQTSDVALSTPHQRQIMMRMAALLVNRVHARILEYQLGQKTTPVASKLINTDFTIPTSLTQNDINNSIRSEHLQGIKHRLQEISKQHRENLMNEQSKTLTRVKRMCRTGIEKQQITIPKSTVKVTTKSTIQKPRSTNVIEKERVQKPRSTNVIEKERMQKPRSTNVIEKERVQEEQDKESVKSWISSLHSNVDSAKKMPTKRSNTSLDSDISSSGHSTSARSSSSKSEASEVSEKTSGEDSQSQSDTSESSESASEIEDDVELSKKDGTGQSSSSIPEEIERSTTSSIPTEIDSRISVSEQSYLESVASTSRSKTPTINRPAVKKLSPTSEYLQKLRNEVTKGRS